MQFWRKCIDILDIYFMWQLFYTNSAILVTPT